MENLPWDMIGAIFGVLSFLLTLIVERNNLGALRRVVIPILIGVVVFIIIGVALPWILPPPSSPVTETPNASASTLALYDTFDNSKYDGYINQALWEVNIEDEMTVNQNNGKLVFQASEPNDWGALWVNPINGIDAPFQSYNFIEAKFSWEPEIKEQLFFGITVQQSWSPRVAYGCDFILSEDGNLLHCSGIDGEQTISPKDISVISGQAYKLRFEVDPVTATFMIYFDDTLIDTYEPPFPEKWLQGQITYDLHLGAGPDSLATVYVDDVRFGKIK